MTNDMHREAFERWISYEGKWGQSLGRAMDGSYIYMQTHTSWSVWQAAMRYRDELEKERQS